MQVNRQDKNILFNISTNIKTPDTMYRVFGVPGGIRTPDLLVRSQSLYPAELQAHLLTT